MTLYNFFPERSSRPASFEPLSLLQSTAEWPAGREPVHHEYVAKCASVWLSVQRWPQQPTAADDLDLQASRNWLRSPALRGYRTNREGRKGLETAREQSCLEKEYWKRKKRDVRKNQRLQKSQSQGRSVPRVPGQPSERASCLC